MLRTLLVSIHAGAGIGGLIAGLPTLSPRFAVSKRRTWVRWLYAVCVAALLASMVALVVVDWPHLELGARVAFAGLTVLGAVIATRLALAHRETQARRDQWQSRYVDHLYFTYISLWIGFLIVPALNTTFPHVAVPLTVLTTLLVGHALITRLKKRLPDGGSPSGFSADASGSSTPPPIPAGDAPRAGSG